MAVPAILLSAVLAAPAAPVPVARDSGAADTVRVVRTLPPVEVRADPFGDRLSSETVHRIPTESLRLLPLDRAAQGVALKAGVVARGEDLHVRGGRSSEIETVLGGLSLTEPFRGRSMDVPLLAVKSAELLSGGMDADVGGALAGAIELETRAPRRRPEAELEWRSDAGETGYDRVAARVAGPVPGTGLALAATADATLDDTWLPVLRSNGRRRVLGGSFGWRAENRLLGDLQLRTAPAGSGLALEILGARRLSQPYDPAWSVDGWTTRCDDPWCAEGPKVSPVPVDGYVRYRAADHRTVTDDRQLASVLSLEGEGPGRYDAVSLGWMRTRTITSVGGRDDESYLTKSRAPVFGFPDSPTSEPFDVYLGDEPYFRKSWSESFQLHARMERHTPHGEQFKLGAGLRYDEVALRSFDLALRDLGLDSLRQYHAWAPGGFLYAHGRWWFEGLAANAGLRLEYFTAGPQAEDQSLGAPAKDTWTVSPRLGFAYPVSDRDAFSLSYVRIQQAPPRDFLYDNRLKITNRQPIGNPAIGPATSISWQAALKHRIDAAWSVQAALFYRDLFGVIVPRNVRPARSIARVVYTDEGSGSASGIELSLAGAPAPATRIEVHYTWMDARGTISSAEGVPYGSTLAWRPGSISQHPLDWDRRHSFTLALIRGGPRWSLGWTTLAGSALPWTPAERRTLEADDSKTNSRRLAWEETSALAVRWSPPWTGARLTLGIDVLNVFDERNVRSVSVDGYPNSTINTVYDDYAAWRTETGLGGGAYWNDRNGDGLPGWRPVHDPRLLEAPRSIRLFAGTAW